MGRTNIHSPVNGYVTNLLARLGDYANVGQSRLSLVDADSYWVDGYFEETNLEAIQRCDPANIKLMGYREVVHGHVDSIARGINVPNALADQAGLASVNPIFTWVRLAQRIPVRIHIDQVPNGALLIQGMTATVEVQHRDEFGPIAGRSFSTCSIRWPRWRALRTGLKLAGNGNLSSRSGSCSQGCVLTASSIHSG